MQPLTVPLLPLAPARVPQPTSCSPYMQQANDRRSQSGGVRASSPKHPAVMHILKPNNQLVALTKIDLDRQELREWPAIDGATANKGAAVLSLQHNLLTKITSGACLHFVVLLDLYHNRLTSLSGLAALPALRVLLVAKNRLTRLDGLKEVAHLEVLDLHGNQLQHLHGLSTLKKLRVLNAAGNILREVSGLRGLDSLLELNLRRNLIRTVVDLHYLPKLQKLFLAHNEIFRYEDMSSVQGCLKLKELSLHHNPLSRNSLYFNTAIAKLYRLKRLDDREIDLEMRKSAEKLLQKAREREKARDCRLSSAVSRASAITSAKNNWHRLKGAHKMLLKDVVAGAESSDEKKDSDQSAVPEISSVTEDHEETREKPSATRLPKPISSDAHLTETEQKGDSVISYTSDDETADPPDVADEDVKQEIVLAALTYTENAKCGIDRSTKKIELNSANKSVSKKQDSNKEKEHQNQESVSIVVERSGSSPNLLSDAPLTDKPLAGSMVRSASCWNLVPTIPSSVERNAVSPNYMAAKPRIRSGKTSCLQKPRPLKKSTSSRSICSLPEHVREAGLNSDSRRPRTASKKSITRKSLLGTSSSDSDCSPESLHHTSETAKSSTSLQIQSIESSSGKQSSVNDEYQSSEFHGIKELEIGSSTNNNSDQITTAKKKNSSSTNRSHSMIDVNRDQNFKTTLPNTPSNNESSLRKTVSNVNVSDLTQPRDTTESRSSQQAGVISGAEYASGHSDAGHNSSSAAVGGGRSSTETGTVTSSTSGGAGNSVTTHSTTSSGGGGSSTGGSTGILRQQGKHYLAELSSGTLSLYGPGALACLDLTWDRTAATAATTAKFQYINFDQIIVCFPKLRNKFPKLQNFTFEETHLSRCGQLNALAELHQVRTLNVGSDGNPITEDDQWRLYAVFRLTHWGLMVVNSVPVSDEERHEAMVRFGPLSQLAFQCLPRDHLTALLVASRNRTGAEGNADDTAEDSAASTSLSAPHLQELIGKEALQYRLPCQDQGAEEDGPVAGGRRAARRLLLWATESAARLALLDTVWPAVLHDLARDALADFAKANYGKSLLDSIKAQMHVNK